jgi:hypothetical protein
MDIMYALPELKIKTHQLEDLADIIETSGFNLVREDKINVETRGNYSGSPVSGTFSFTLNQVRWLMYEKKVNNKFKIEDYKNNSLRDIVFLSEKNDLIVKRKDTINQSNNAINVIRLDGFLKEYELSNKFLMSKKESNNLNQDDASQINAKYYPSIFNCGLYAFGGGMLIFSELAMVYVENYKLELPSNAYVWIGLGALAAYLMEKFESNDRRKEANILVTMMDNKIKENRYLLGQNALEYIIKK